MTKLAEELMQSGTVKAPKHVHIKNDYGHVDQDCIRISHGAGEQVVWFHHGSSEARIAFDKNGSPFAQSEFLVPSGQSTPSGDPTVEPDGDRLYRYSVHGGAGVNDPVVIIDK